MNLAVLVVPVFMSLGACTGSADLSSSGVEQSVSFQSDIDDANARALVQFQNDYPGVSLVSRDVWSDPNGCLHFIGDDGTEGYLIPLTRLDGSAICNA